MSKINQLDWDYVKSRLKARWEKLEETDFAKFRGNMHLIPMRIESIYKISRIQAKEEYGAFIKSLEQETPK